MSERMEEYLKHKAAGTAPKKGVPFTKVRRDCRTKKNFPSVIYSELPMSYIKEFNRLNHLKDF